MIYTTTALGGMVTAPHHLAAQAGARVLREGGTAVEAMVAAAAAIAVVYPFMTSIGGDGFWLIAEPGQDPIGIDAAGQSAALATLDHYREAAGGEIPSRGGLAALTCAGTIGGWQAALDHVASTGRTPLPLSRLMEEAVHHARNGIAVTVGQEETTRAKLDGLRDVPGFAETYLSSDGEVLKVNDTLKQPALGATLEHLGKAGLDDFYRGDIARANAAFLEKTGSPLRLSDLEACHARRVTPMSVPLKTGRVFNMPPPTQGVSSLMILGLFDRLGIARTADVNSYEHIHGLVEATKQAFILRNRHLADLSFMDTDPNDWLTEETLDRLAARIDRDKALPWPVPDKPGDTIWMGAIDGEGRAVSFIQSIFWEYGSGVVVPETGVVWQNRGHGFSTDPGHPNRLEPGKRPFHTLNPAMARLTDGRLLTYGTMGGEGQPQTQAAVYSRYAMFGRPLQEAVTAPRWLLGRTWGDVSTSLKLEDRFDPALVEALRKAGHQIDILPAFDSLMGHAGAIARLPNGVLEGATDPRSDGGVAAF